MSLPVEQIYCDRCDFRSNTMVTWGYYIYRLADRRPAPLNRAPGWCYACSNLVPVEDFWDRESIKGKIAEIERQLLESTPTGLARWLPWKRSNARYELEHWQQELEHAINRRDFLIQRKSPPRCLKCGATEIIPLEYVTPAAGEPPVRIDFAHPDCGGYFWIASEGLRVALRFPKALIYDSEGRHLGREVIS